MINQLNIAVHTVPVVRVLPQRNVLHRWEVVKIGSSLVGRSDVRCHPQASPVALANLFNVNVMLQVPSAGIEGRFVAGVLDRIHVSDDCSGVSLDVISCPCLIIQRNCRPLFETDPLGITDGITSHCPGPITIGAKLAPVVSTNILPTGLRVSKLGTGLGILVMRSL